MLTVFYRKGKSDWGTPGYFLSTIYEDERLWFGTLTEAKKNWCEYHGVPNPTDVNWKKMP